MQGIIDRIRIDKRKPRRSFGIILGYDGEQYLFRLDGKTYSVGSEVVFRGVVNEKGNFAQEVKELSC